MSTERVIEVPDDAAFGSKNAAIHWEAIPLESDTTPPVLHRICTSLLTHLQTFDCQREDLNLFSLGDLIQACREHLQEEPRLVRVAMVSGRPLLLVWLTRLLSHSKFPQEMILAWLSLIEDIIHLHPSATRWGDHHDLVVVLLLTNRHFDASFFLQYPYLLDPVDLTQQGGQSDTHMVYPLLAYLRHLRHRTTPFPEDECLQMVRTCTYYLQSTHLFERVYGSLCQSMPRRGLSLQFMVDVYESYAGVKPLTCFLGHFVSGLRKSQALGPEDWRVGAYLATQAPCGLSSYIFGDLVSLLSYNERLMTPSRHCLEIWAPKITPSYHLTKATLHYAALLSRGHFRASLPLLRHGLVYADNEIQKLDFLRFHFARDVWKAVQAKHPWRARLAAWHELGRGAFMVRRLTHDARMERTMDVVVREWRREVREVQTNLEPLAQATQAMADRYDRGELLNVRTP